jgi:hypothetical protein
MLSIGFVNRRSGVQVPHPAPALPIAFNVRRLRSQTETKSVPGILILADRTGARASRVPILCDTPQGRFDLVQMVKGSLMARGDCSLVGIPIE